MSIPTPSLDLHDRLIRIDRRGILLLWGAVFWLMGALLWAGATYEKFQSMDKHLSQIDEKLSILDDVRMIRQREDDVIRRIEIIEQENQRR